MTVYAITDTKKGRTGIAPTYLQTTPEILLGKYNCPSPGTDIQCVLTLFSVVEGRTVEILPHYFPSPRDGQ